MPLSFLFEEISARLPLVHRQSRPEQSRSNQSDFRQDKTVQSAKSVQSTFLTFLFLRLSLSISFSPPFDAPSQTRPPAATSVTPYLLTLARLPSATAASCPFTAAGTKGQGREVKRTRQRRIKRKRAREAVGPLALPARCRLLLAA